MDDKPFDPRNSCILVLTTDVEPEIQLVTCLEKVDEWYLYHVFYSIGESLIQQFFFKYLKF